MTDIKCPYCGAEDNDCISDFWEIEEEVKELECGSCQKQIIVNYKVSVIYEVKRKDCKHCDDSGIMKTAYKADLPSNVGEKVCAE